MKNSRIMKLKEDYKNHFKDYNLIILITIQLVMRIIDIILLVISLINILI